MLKFERPSQEFSGGLAGVFGQVGLGVICIAAACANLENGLELCTVGMWVTARHHLDYQAAERPDVGFLGVRSLTHDFGCHPEHGTLKRNSWSSALMWTWIEKCRCLYTLTNTKVRNLDCALVIHQDVCAFDVSVDDILGMQVIQALQDLPHEI